MAFENQIGRPSGNAPYIAPMAVTDFSLINPFIEALPEAALVVDRSGIVRAVNRSAQATFAAEMVDQPIILFIRSPSVAKAIAASFDSEAPFEVEFEEHAKVARIIHAHLARFDVPGMDSMVLLVLRDRTREAQVEKMRSDFVANASHELRTPLTTLSGFIETMQGAARQDEKARGEFLKLMKAQAERMSGLIDDLLSLSRIELDAHVEPRDRTNLSSVVHQTESLLRPVATEAGCEMVFRVLPNIHVRGDANQLGQVVHNLIENAIKYSGRGKRVSVDLTLQGGEAVLSVSDNGPGIAPHHIPRLTERFYRVNVQDSRTRGGTGLGLAICKHIINRHRGRLDIKSQLGIGSEFQVALPVID
jgi:two-component system, OmpR family, phosphate regulon sensor histidine kinase PhoR